MNAGILVGGEQAGKHHTSDRGWIEFNVLDRADLLTAPPLSAKAVTAEIKREHYDWMTYFGVGFWLHESLKGSDPAPLLVELLTNYRPVAK